VDTLDEGRAVIEEDPVKIFSISGAPRASEMVQGHLMGLLRHHNWVMRVDIFVHPAETPKEKVPINENGGRHGMLQTE
jgi:hypothetical protein